MQNPFVFGWLGSSDSGGGGTSALLTGFVAGAGTVAATDTILQAFNKLAGNGALYVLKTGDTMTDSLNITNSSNSQKGFFVYNSNAGASAYAGFEARSDAGYARFLLNSVANVAIGGAGSLNIGRVEAYPVAFFTNNTARFIISGTGTFGIGTAPTAGELISIATTLPTLMSATSTSVDGTYFLLTNTSAAVSKQWYIGIRGSGSGADSGNFYLYNGTDEYYGLQIAKASGLVSLHGGLSIGGTAVIPGTNGINIFTIKTGTAPTTIPADVVQIYSSDSAGAGTSSLSLYQEAAPYAGIGVASTTKIPVVWNGVTYYILATTVA